jgi:hypothetical protein
VVGSDDLKGNAQRLGSTSQSEGRAMVMALAAGHRLNAISFEAGTLTFHRAYAMTSASFGADLAQPLGLAGIL